MENMAQKQPRPKPVQNPRSFTAEERAWLEQWSLEAHGRLVDGLIERVGLPQQTAWGVAGYLAARHRGAPAAIISDPTKAAYRKYLRQLGTPTPIRAGQAA